MYLSYQLTSVFFVASTRAIQGSHKLFLYLAHLYVSKVCFYHAFPNVDTHIQKNQPVLLFIQGSNMENLHNNVVAHVVIRAEILVSVSV